MSNAGGGRIVFVASRLVVGGGFVIHSTVGSAEARLADRPIG